MQTFFNVKSLAWDMVLHDDINMWKFFLNYFPLKEYQLDIGTFTSESTSKTELWCYPWCQPEQVVEQTINFLMIWDVMMLMWRNCNENAYLTFDIIRILRGYAIQAGKHAEGSQRPQGGPQVHPAPDSEALKL